MGGMMAAPDWKEMTIEFLGVGHTVMQQVLRELEDAIPRQAKETRASATAAYATTARLDSLCRGLKCLLEKNEIEAASVFLRPLMEVAAAGAYLQRADPRKREQLARRYLLLPSVLGPLRYAREAVKAKAPEADSLKPGIAALEKLEAEFRQQPGKLTTWHGGGGVRDILRGAGLTGHNEFFIDLLHGDMHGASAARFIRLLDGGLKFIPEGNQAPTMTAIPLMVGWWGASYVESSLLTEATRAALVMFSAQAVSLQELVSIVIGLGSSTEE